VSAGVVANGGEPFAGLLRLPGAAEALADARAAVDRLLAHPMMRRRGSEVAAEAALRSARASAALDGRDLALASVRAGSADPVVQGALRVLGALGELAATLPRAPLQVLARLHVLAAADLEPADRLGRPRVATAEVSARLGGLTALVRAAPEVPALLVAALVEAEVLVVAPFERGNGLVARGLSRLVLVQRGLDPRGICPVEVGAAERADRYHAAAAGYAGGDVTGWLLCYADAVGAGAAEGLAVCEALLRAGAPG
jgi:hypothetical protein